MSSAIQTSPNAFTTKGRDRLASYVAKRQGNSKSEIVALTPDASTREYFRIPWDQGTAVAAVYPEPFDPEVHPYLDVTRLFLECRLPVPLVHDVDGAMGIIVQEDLGDRQLCQVFETATDEESESLIEQAIEIIARIQTATPRAFERDSIASRLAFDEAKLAWELNFFVEHYFGSLRGETLRHGQAAELKAELNDVAAELSACRRVLCHRDYHSANLLVDRRGQIRIVDHQDARMGPASYDLVSLLMDRQPCPPSLGEVRGHRLFFLEERRRHNLDPIDPDDFAKEFRLMTIQRGLKAIGTFSFQTAVCGRGALYEKHIQPTFQIVLQAADWLDRFPVLRQMINERLNG
ncbi:MAG: N-acetylmuramate 1-kinase [Blastocatellia bacterium]|jgi:aminoglycoside/choline kinase family phosphotransferase|nr:N-acetylmuramate 1-kinase [Blastocatellia bacterium]